ncbi:5-oxoprolinase subunit PxpB [Halomonas organivorans]|uniref:KipI family sensor histidine kinase inhibitor n=1 Tax=Halomonas organivorans TaxID=257772 RepID=A0A7W5BY85_9GAMM|nr:5-oxoprolinase subunit PxpB [Halomonas organivorans]MBB3140843.1 KipI family sensor histidine kinase inhibitor [Halomonas organivorans]
MAGRTLPRLEAAGLDGWLVRLFEAIDEANLPWLTALVRDCETAFGEALVDLVPSYTTLLVVFDPLALTPAEARQRLSAVLASLTPHDDADREAPLRELPTWYDERMGPELPRLAERAGMSVADIVACHAGATYRVYALGFAPGFAFMGSVAECLECPRLETPRKKVPAGSVGIAGRQTAAYPAVSPGGWNLIGRTSARLFDRDREGFGLLALGDRVRFVAVTRDEFERLGGDPRPMEAGR